MVFANIEDHRKPFLSAMFAVISLATATFVYLAVDGKNSIDRCHNITLPPNGTSSNMTTTTATSTVAPPSPSLASVGSGTPSTTVAPTGDGGRFKIIEVDKFLDAVTGGVVLFALLAASSVAVVLSVYCRSVNGLRIGFAVFFMLTLTLLYPLIVFGQALPVGHDCENVALRVVPSSCGLFVVGLATLLFFTETLNKIRTGDEPSLMSRLNQS